MPHPVSCSCILTGPWVLACLLVTTAAAPAAVEVDSATNAFCFGQGADGQLGNGDTDSSSTPVEVSRDLSLAMIATDTSRSCGLDWQGKAWCWGFSGADDLTGEERLKETTWVPGVAEFVQQPSAALALGDGLCSLNPQGKSDCIDESVASECCMNSNLGPLPPEQPI